MLISIKFNHRKMFTMVYRFHLIKLRAQEDFYHKRS